MAVGLGVAGLPALLLASSPLAGAAASCPTVSQMAAQGGWSSVVAPHFPAASSAIALPYADQITAFAVDPSAPDQMFVTNGDVVLRSRDTGCTWQTSFRLPPLPSLPGDPSELDSRIVSIAIPPLGRGDVFLQVVRQPLVAGSTAVAGVMHSADHGQTWVESDGGLPATPAPATGSACADLAACGLVPSSSEPRIVYYFDRRTSGEPGGVFASLDGGRSWVRRAAPGGASDALLAGPAPAVPPIVAMRVDPLDAPALWTLLASGALYHSSDGAKSWRLAGTQPGGHPVLLDVDHLVGSPTRVLVLGQDGPGQLWRWQSMDGGQTFARSAVQALAGSLVSLARAPATGQLMVVTTAGVYAYDRASDRFANVAIAGLPALDQAQATAGPDPLFAFRSARLVALYRRPVPGATPVSGNGGALSAIRTLTGADWVAPGSSAAAPANASLEPADTRLTLQSGQATGVTYQLRTVPSLPPLDVFLLINSSDEMRPNNAALSAALQSIVHGLVAAGANPQFGVGEYHDLRVRYHLLRDIAPPGPDLGAELAAIAARSNNGDNGEEGEIGEEANYTALDQLATGSGIPHPSQGAPVAPGQQAHFRPGSLRVVIDVANEPIEADPDGPSRDAAVASLQAKDIRHIGLEFVDEGGFFRAVPLPGPAGGVPLPLPGLQPPPPGTGGGGPGGGAPGGGRSTMLRQQLEYLSTATGGLAPAGGVSCGGVDVPFGAPMVCSVPSQGANLDLVTPLLSMLLSLQHSGPVRLAAATAGPIRATVPDLYPSVDLRSGQLLAFPVTLLCPADAPSGTWPVNLAGEVRGQPVASARAVVQCVAPAPALTAFLPFRAPVVAAAPGAAAGPSVLAVPASGSASAQGASVPAAAYAPEEEPQLATANLNQSDEHRFSSRRQAAANEARWAGEAAMSLVAVALLRRRRQLAVNSSRRSRR